MENIKDRIHVDFEKLKENKEEYFEQFYKNNYNFVYRICFSILKDKENSEDVSQAIFEKLYKMPVDNLASNYESSWLYTVAKNEAIQFIRKNKFHDSLDESNVVVEDKESGIDQIEVNEDYKKMVNKLNKKQERIVSLKVVSDFTFKEIGQMLSMPTATVQWYYYSSLKSLKAAIGSMAMFIICTVHGIRLYKEADTAEEQHHNEKINKDAVQQNSETASCEIGKSSENDHHEHKGILQNIMSDSEDVHTAVVDSVDEASQNSNATSLICFGLAGIFLVVSIIFGIIFVKRKKYIQIKITKTTY